MCCAWVCEPYYACLFIMYYMFLRFVFCVCESVLWLRCVCVVYPCVICHTSCLVCVPFGFLLACLRYAEFALHCKICLVGYVFVHYAFVIFNHFIYVVLLSHEHCTYAEFLASQCRWIIAMTCFKVPLSRKWHRIYSCVYVSYDSYSDGVAFISMVVDRVHLVWFGLTWSDRISFYFIEFR